MQTNSMPTRLDDNEIGRASPRRARSCRPPQQKRSWPRDHGVGRFLAANVAIDSHKSLDDLGIGHWWLACVGEEFAAVATISTREHHRDAHHNVAILSQSLPVLPAPSKDSLKKLIPALSASRILAPSCRVRRALGSSWDPEGGGSVPDCRGPSAGTGVVCRLR